MKEHLSFVLSIYSKHFAKVILHQLTLIKEITPFCPDILCSVDIKDIQMDRQGYKYTAAPVAERLRALFLSRSIISPLCPV